MVQEYATIGKVKFWVYMDPMTSWTLVNKKFAVDFKEFKSKEAFWTFETRQY